MGIKRRVEMKKIVCRFGIPMMSSVIMLLLSAGTAHAQLTNSLVFYANFDSDFNNSVGNQHTAFPIGDPAISTDARFGKGSVYLDGDDELIFDDSATGGGPPPAGS